jgi:hypothetical protein
MTPNLFANNDGLRASLRLALDTMASPEVMATSGAGGDSGPWAEPIRRVDQALDRGDIQAVLRAWNTAGLAARDSGGWEGYIALGDAALRVAFATGFQIAFAGEARHAFLLALGRAHRQRSIGGVLRIAQGFAALGDEDLVEQCLHLADRFRD